MTYASEVLADSPLAYWRLEETSNASPVADSTANARNGTYDSAATHPAGLIVEGGTALSGMASVPAAAWQTALTGLTVECLFKTSSSAAQALVGRSNAASFGTVGSNFWRTYINAGALVFQIFDSTWTPFITLTTPVSTYADGAVHHAAATWDGNTARWFVDGALICSNAATGTMVGNSGTVPIGLGHFAGNAPLSGVLDDPAVYDHALSAARIAAHYTAGTAPAPAATGTASLSLSASGSTSAPAGGSASLSLSASGGLVPPVAASGSAALSLSASGGASGAAAGSASLNLTATGAALAVMAASGSATLTLSASGSAVMSAAGTATLTLSAGGVALAVYTTDLSNALDGLDLLLTATVTFVVPVVAPPASLAPAQRYDKAIAYPTPVLDGGRVT